MAKGDDKKAAKAAKKELAKQSQYLRESIRAGLPDHVIRAQIAKTQKAEREAKGE